MKRYTQPTSYSAINRRECQTDTGVFEFSSGVNTPKIECANLIEVSRFDSPDWCATEAADVVGRPLNRHHHHINDWAFAKNAVGRFAYRSHHEALGNFLIHALVWLEAVKGFFGGVGQLF
jgi:hypothetical protein